MFFFLEIINVFFSLRAIMEQTIMNSSSSSYVNGKEEKSYGLGPAKPTAAGIFGRQPPSTTESSSGVVGLTNNNNKFPASSATEELDDLMTSLNTFKIKEGPAEEPVTTALDDMLGNLQVRLP